VDARRGGGANASHNVAADAAGIPVGANEFMRFCAWNIDRQWQTEGDNSVSFCAPSGADGNAGDAAGLLTVLRYYAAAAVASWRTCLRRLVLPRRRRGGAHTSIRWARSSQCCEERMVSVVMKCFHI
jgi:hypothetical protein